MFAFTGAYLLDMGFSVTQVTMIQTMQYAVSIGMLLCMGRITDRSGHCLPLLIVSCSVGVCMFLWVLSAWWGIVAVIAYQLINGAAGHTHSMLGINYGLEIFPDKGRSGYLAFSRLFIGIVSITTASVSGFILHAVQGWRMTLWGATLTHYHLFFFCCSIVTLCCTIPLGIVGDRAVPRAP